MNIQQVIESQVSVELANAISPRVPPQMGHYFAGLLARRLASQPAHNMVRAVRANQWVVHQEKLTGPALSACVQAALQYTARSLYDLYHYLDNPGGFRRSLILDDATRSLLRRPQFDRRGLLIAGLHLNSLDLLLQWLAQKGMRPLVLTLPENRGGRRLEEALRQKSGANLVPTNIASLLLALRHLRSGGIVISAIDRPMPGASSYPMFFGRPAALPTHHAYLAARAGVPLMLMAAVMQADEKYHVITSPLLEMDTHLDRDLELLHNAEKVLAVAEDFIRLAPEQWTVTQPVWPDVLEMFSG